MVVAFRYDAGNRLKLPFRRIPDRRNCIHQCSGIRVLWMFKQLPHRCLLNDLPCIHDDDTVCHMRYQSDVMGDQDHGHFVFLLQLL